MLLWSVCHSAGSLIDVGDVLLHRALFLESPLPGDGMVAGLDRLSLPNICGTAQDNNLLLSDILLLESILGDGLHGLFARLVFFRSLASFSLACYLHYLLMVVANYCWNFSLFALVNYALLLLMHLPASLNTQIAAAPLAASAPILRM